jgi:hypothetical protein
MGAPRKNPPPNALADIDRLAQSGYSTTGLARFFKVSRSVIVRWFKEDEHFEETFEQGIDVYRQSLEEKIIAYTAAGKQCAGLIFLMKARFKYFDVPNNAATKVDVNVAVATPVMIVRDFGTDEEWAERALAQQQSLTSPEAKRSLPISTPKTIAPSWIEGHILTTENETEEIPQYVRDSVAMWIEAFIEESDEVVSTPAKPVEAPVWRGNA